MKSNLGMFVILGIVLGIILGFVAGMTTVAPKTKIVTQTKVQTKVKTKVVQHQLASGDSLDQALSSFSPKKFVGKPQYQVYGGQKFLCLTYINNIDKAAKPTNEKWLNIFCVNARLVA